MSVLFRPQPPPPPWHLRVALREGSDRAALDEAERIISSYLDDKQYRRISNEKGDLYCLQRIDHVIDRSILVTVQNELFPVAVVTREDEPCQSHH